MVNGAHPPRGILNRVLDREPAEATPRSEELASPQSGRRTLVAYLGPDLADSAVRRRVAQWRDAGFEVLPLAFTRNAGGGHSAEFVNLGRMTPLSRARRIGPLMRAAVRIVARRRMLAKVRLFAARNLDIALLALLARRVSGSSAPIVYEVLDVNTSCTEPGWRGRFLRRLERWVLVRTDLLVVSSPYFATAYYQGFLGYRGNWFLFENKIPRWIGVERQALAPPGVLGEPRRRRWRVGWFGYLDDEKSWRILRTVAERLPDDVAICVRGTPYTHFDMDRFLADVDALDNVTYGGPYRNPEDLAEVYGAVDLVWSTDFNFPNTNSKWVLTNGIYEAGFFNKPVLGLVGSAVGEFLSKHGSGWTLSEPMEESLMRFIRNLTPERYEAKRREIAALPAQLFIEGNEIAAIWQMVQERGAAENLPKMRERIPRLDADEPEPADAGASVPDLGEAGFAARRKIVVMGLFPPPINGQRIVNQRMLECFDAAATVLRCDIDRFPSIGKFSKLFSAILGCGLLLRARMRGFSTVYLAPHSGAGLICSCLLALTARSAGFRLAVHYHSYRNLGRRSRLMSAFLALCGPDALHIVLAPPMADDLRRFYPSVRQVTVLSNTTFVEPGLPARPSALRRLRIGHLSNLSREKGIATVFECMRALLRHRIDCELWLAGPAEDAETSALIAAAQEEFRDRINYFGPMAASDVDTFYREIDVFLFPTLYEHEAEPLVIADALANGVPVFATDRGCIKYMIGESGGRVLPLESFVERAAAQVGAWAENRQELAQASARARDRFVQARQEALGQLDRLLATVLATQGG